MRIWLPPKLRLARIFRICSTFNATDPVPAGNGRRLVRRPGQPSPDEEAAVPADGGKQARRIDPPGTRNR